MRDEMDCGCYWTRETEGPCRGDVLHQCDAHRAGASYGPASEPGDLSELLGVLRESGARVEVLREARPPGWYEGHAYAMRDVAHALGRDDVTLEDLAALAPRPDANEEE